MRNSSEHLGCRQENIPGVLVTPTGVPTLREEIAITESPPGTRIDLHGWFIGDPLLHRDAAGHDTPPRSLPDELFTTPPARATTAARHRQPRSDHSSGVLAPSTEHHARRPSPLDLKRTQVQVGSVVDKYRIDALLGTGGFAVVYRATHLLLRVPVAIKLLKPEILAAHPAQAERLCEEARFAAQVNHANVVRIYDVTHTENITYIVMEYVDGPSLQEAFTADHPLPPYAAIHLALDVVHGLRAALAQGMIHRDIKPANILLTRKGVAKIVDLGLARQSGGADIQPHRSVSSAAREVVGTPSYMAPEQAINPERVDCRSDMYALGVTLYQITTGRLPFTGGDAVTIITKHIKDPVPSPRAFFPQYPVELERILLWLLAKDVQDRPTSYEQLIEALQDVGRSLTIDAADIAPRPSRSGLMDRIRTLFTNPL